MFQSARTRFLNYYNNELRYLRNAGQAFAKQYPKIARRLEISDAVSPDPHTERLLESFAFMTARLSQEIDDRFPELASTLLGVLYPHLVNPLPTMAIAQFQPDLSKAKQTVGYTFKKSTPLFTYTEQGVTCRFQTVYPLTLWPITVQSVSFVPKESYVLDDLSERAAAPWFLKLTVQIDGGLSWQDLTPDDLTFHLGGERVLTLGLYQSLFGQTNPRVFISGDQKRASVLPVDSLQPVGFSREEMGLPVTSQTTHAYQLLQEYFHLPEKFLFFKIQHLATSGKIDPTCQTIDILFPFATVEPFLQKNVSAQNFLLGCTPIINLFHKTTEPLRLTRRKVDYPLIPDQRRDKTTQIHSIQKVIATIEGEASSQTLTPYFSFNHQTNHDDHGLYWLIKRIPAELRDVPGSDMQISFVDLKFNPVTPAHHIIYAETLCTNRFLAEQLPYNAQLQIEEVAPLTQIVCLNKPVLQVDPPTDGESLWRLVSQLSVNHLGLSEEGKSLELLKEALKLYAGPAYAAHQHEVDEIMAIHTQKVTRRFGKEAWRGFVEGLEVSLSLKPSIQTGHTCFLLASVLRHYFALNVGLTSFVELVLKTDSHLAGQHKNFAKEWMRWQLLPGAKIQL
ncbi:type VI secretion system baseplate subunit TssF [Candidatus Finniella inopinata]|uniref:type VI secretion system baseplate subunit TssF n=1 Tax=Candidatus Finniella inopinata TaxID=1696036 RepID=UPI0013EEB59C|nr:type VI secretion system baseplate subunit TssF [Candidatus Finniella inopinata]